MKDLLLTVPLLLSINLFAQVGINTKNPQGAFHVDAKGDNIVNASNTTDDLIYTTNGMLGVGTTPTTKFHINNGTTNGAIRIVDGTQGVDKILTSDADGIGTWKSSGITNIPGTTPTTATSFGSSANKFMGGQITLTQGKWFVYVGLFVNGATAANTRYAARFTLSNSQTAISTSGYAYLNGNRLVLAQVSNGNAGAVTGSMFASGVIRVDVTSASTTLYLWDENTRVYGNVPTTVTVGGNAGDYLFAIKAN